MSDFSGNNRSQIWGEEMVGVAESMNKCPFDKNKINSHIGSALRLARELMGISRTELAALCSFDDKTVNRFETGETEMTAEELYEISSFLNVSVDFFFDPIERGSLNNRRS